MSRYHPLDVRHPDNRDLLRRNFLLDPPAERAPRPSREARDAARTAATAQSAPPAPAASGPQSAHQPPWGGTRGATQKGASPAQPPTGRTGSTTRTRGNNQQRRNGSAGRWLFLIVIGYWLIAGGGRDWLMQFPMIRSLLASIEGFLNGL